MIHILIIKLGSIGDVLRTTCLLKPLKQKYPACSISWVTKRNAYEILANNEYLDHVYVIEEELEQIVKEGSYDLVISLDDERGACALASLVPKRKLVGAYLEGERLTYTPDSAPWFDMGLLFPVEKGGLIKANELKKANRLTYQEILLEMFHLPKENQYILNIPQKDQEFARDFARQHGLSRRDVIVGMSSSAGPRWQFKKLSAEKTACLMDALRDTLDVKLMLLGGPEECERNSRIRTLCKTGIIDAGCENSLMQFCGLVNLCDLLITSDSLTMHIGIALNKKVVVFFGPTSSAEIELYDRGVKLTPQMDCLVCYKTNCDFKPNCMDLLKIEDFIKAAQFLLQNQPIE